MFIAIVFNFFRCKEENIRLNIIDIALLSLYSFVFCFGISLLKAPYSQGNAFTIAYNDFIKKRSGRRILRSIQEVVLLISIPVLIFLSIKGIYHLYTTGESSSIQAKYLSDNDGIYWIKSADGKILKAKKLRRDKNVKINGPYVNLIVFKTNLFGLKRYFITNIDNN